MSTVPSPAQPRSYPLAAPADDRRFTLGLVFAVAQVLAGHGFPEITSGGDLVALQQALYGFVYAAPAPTGGVILGQVDLEGEPPSLCYGAPWGFEGDCGHPGPHDEHPLDSRPHESGDAR